MGINELPKDVSRGILILVVLALGVLLFGAGMKFQDFVTPNDFHNDLLDTEVTLQELASVRNRNATLLKALNDAGDTENELRQQIAHLRQQPKEIEYIYQIETVLVPEEPEVVYKTLPAQHSFFLKEGLEVASFKTVEEQYHFNTYEVSLRSQVVVTPRRTSVMLQGSTSANPDSWVELPVEVQARRIVDPHKDWEPNLLIGFTGGLSRPTSNDSGINGLAAGSVVGLFWHPHKNVSALGVRASVGRTPSIGFDPVYYNLGSKLPVFTNIWLGPGVSFDTETNIQIGLTIGGKL